MAKASKPESDTPTLDKAVEATIKYVPIGQEREIELSISRAMKFLCKPTKSGAMPDVPTVVNFLMICQARKLNPYVGDVYLTGYDSKDGPQFAIITSYQAISKRAELHPQYDGIESGIIVERDGEIERRVGTFRLPHEVLVGAWAKVYRKDRTRPTDISINRKAYDKGFSIWSVNPDWMLVKCFDNKTEVLTDQGFRLFSEIRSERIMQVTDNGLEPVSALPFSQEYSGEMVEYSDTILNFCVTPSHTMVTDKGRLLASELLEQSRSRPIFKVPLVSPKRLEEFCISDDAIALSAVYLCDGTRFRHRNTFGVKVAKTRKIDMLQSLAMHHGLKHQNTVGRTSHIGSATITCRLPSVSFWYRSSLLEGLVDGYKKTDMRALSQFSARQASIFVETMLSCDGHRGKTCRRFYNTNPLIIHAFETACVIAGLSVSKQIVDRDGNAYYCCSVSSRTHANVLQWNREYHKTTSRGQDRGGLSVTNNDSSVVWCVSVPSQTIIVRRHGMSFVCGNCVNAAAKREAFPIELSDMYIAEERINDKEALDRSVDETEKIIKKTSTVTAAELVRKPTPEQQPAKEESELHLELRRCDTIAAVNDVRSVRSKRCETVDDFDLLNLACDKRIKQLESSPAEPVLEHVGTDGQLFETTPNAAEA